MKTERLLTPLIPGLLLSAGLLLCALLLQVTVAVRAQGCVSPPAYSRQRAWPQGCVGNRQY
jgi:hypothetical protein